ncbi:MAG: hypothetical protein ACI4MO_06265 [Christensenellales bacterium]
MQIEEFVSNYKAFCESKFGSRTGTATSYANALKYLFEYLGFNKVDETAVLTVKSLDPDIRDKHCVFYNSILDEFSSKGRSSYVEKGFLKAAIPALYEFLNEYPLSHDEQADDVLLDAINDNQIIAQFNRDELRRILPTAAYCEHTYDIRRINGTIKDAAKSIYSGRKAEKYFLSFLKDCLGLEQGIDFIDVSNNKEYGYDIRLFDCGIEVKNIKNGGFYLTDNEIARLEHSETHLILVDIDNGIWLLKNNSNWLKQIITNIKTIRKFCSENYKTLDLTDIKININETVNNEVAEVSAFSKEKLKKIISRYGNVQSG